MASPLYDGYSIFIDRGFSCACGTLAGSGVYQTPPLFAERKGRQENTAQRGGLSLKSREGLDFWGMTCKSMFRGAKFCM